MHLRDIALPRLSGEGLNEPTWELQPLEQSPFTVHKFEVEVRHQVNINTSNPTTTGAVQRRISLLSLS